MTGRNPSRWGQRNVARAQFAGLPLTERTIAEELRDAGYATGLLGKWHLGEGAPYRPERRGFEEYYGLLWGALDCQSHSFGGRLDWWRNGELVRESGYSTHLLGRAAADRVRFAPQPFFLEIAFNAAHSPLMACAEHRSLSVGSGDRATLTAMISCLDAQVGLVLAALEQRGIAQETLVDFTSDNGAPTGFGGSDGGFRGHKGSLYEGGVHVPAAVAWPGVLGPGVVDEPVHVTDWYATFAALAGVTPQQWLDGQDVLPVLQGGTLGERTFCLGAEPGGAGAVLRWPYKYLRLHGGRGELYNLQTDPGERRNVAGQQGGAVTELAAALDQYSRESSSPR